MKGPADYNLYLVSAEAGDLPLVVDVDVAWGTLPLARWIRNRQAVWKVIVDGQDVTPNVNAPPNDGVRECAAGSRP